MVAARALDPPEEASALKRLDARYLAGVAALAAIYFAAAKLGLAFASENQSISAVWPPTGIALAALFIFGYGMWPGVALGAFLANATTGVPLLVVAGIALGNTLEALVGVRLLRFAGFRPSLPRLKDVGALFALAGAVSTAVSATTGVLSLHLGGLLSAGELHSSWTVWWFGDMGGALLVAPLLLAFATGVRLDPRPERVAEALALAASVAAVALIWVFTDSPPAYIAFPSLIWAALRFGHAGAILATFGLSAVGILYTSEGVGPFVHGNFDHNLLLSQTFMGVAAVTALTLASAVAERRRAERELERARDRLEAQVRQRTADLVHANGELKRAVRDLEQFGHAISHDLSEPLRGIAGFGELLAERYGSRLDGRADAYIAHIVDGAARMKELIDALLAYSRTGGQALHAADVSCDTLLRDAMDALAVTIEEASAVVTADSLPTVHADPVLLGEVFQQLLSNAMKFTNGHGCRVHVSAEREGAGWRLSFRDRGIGVDPRYAQKVFRVFKRVNGRGDYEGTGIGLAICKKIVESHGGEIRVERAPDHGSVFSFSLPDPSGAVG